jgi:hypothetical protein
MMVLIFGVPCHFLDEIWIALEDKDSLFIWPKWMLKTLTPNMGTKKNTMVAKINRVCIVFPKKPHRPYIVNEVVYNYCMKLHIPQRNSMIQNKLTII